MSQDSKLPPLPPIEEERRVLPYDPLVTIKKALRAALISAAALVGGALLDAVLQVGVLKALLEMAGLSALLIAVAVPVLHAVGTALQNWLKTRHGVYYDRRETFRTDPDHSPAPPSDVPVRKLRVKDLGPPKP